MTLLCLSDGFQIGCLTHKRLRKPPPRFVSWPTPSLVAISHPPSLPLLYCQTSVHSRQPVCPQRLSEPILPGLAHPAFSPVARSLDHFYCDTFPYRPAPSPSAIRHFLLSLLGALCMPLLWHMSPESLLRGHTYAFSLSM